MMQSFVANGYYGSQTFKQLQHEHEMVTYSFYAILSTIFSVIVSIISATIVVKDKLSNLDILTWFFELPAFLEKIIIAIVSTLNCGNSLFGKFTYSGDSVTTGIVEEGFDLFETNQYILVAMTALILIFIGYKVGQSSSSGFIVSINIAFIFTAIQLYSVYLFTISIEGEAESDFIYYMHFDYLSIAIGAFLLATICTMIGTLFSQKVDAPNK